MKKTYFMLTIVCMLCISMSTPAIAMSNVPNVSPEPITTENYQKAQQYIQAINRLPQTNSNREVTLPPQPILGGEDDVFGLWLHVKYGTIEIEQQVDISPKTIRGKLTDPNYRTPTKFDIDSDPEDDIEIGFGFFRYGIDDGTTVHSSLATAFEFRQINDGLPDQYKTLEVWQEFRINLALFKARGVNTESSPYPMLSNLVNFLLEKLGMTIDTLQTHNPLIYDLLVRLNVIHEFPDSQPLAASEDYIATRIGYLSQTDEKIPLHFEKTFAVAKQDTLFRPRIFQHEMNSYDIIGTAANTIGFGFQAYESGHAQPTYDIGFSVDINPAIHSITQFTPREGKIRYYYHTASPDPTEITFTSLVNKGGDPDEEEEGTQSLTLSLDAIPGEMVGSGKWMSFDLDVIHDHDLLGGKFTYKASNKFNVGITVDALGFEETIRVLSMPTRAKLQWDVDFDVSTQSGFMQFDVNGFVELDMSSTLNNIIVYYPKTDPEDPDETFINIHGIPAREKVGAESTLYLKPTNFSNPDNYFYAKAYRDYSGTLGGIQMLLPDTTDPLIEIIDIPAYAAAQGRLQWNRLKGYAKAERWSNGEPDPIFFNLCIDNFCLSNELEIPDGFARGDFHLAEDGYLGFDTSDEILGNTITLSNSVTGNSLSISADAVSADDLWVDWGLDTSGGQIKVEDLFFTGALNSFKDFEISMTLQGKNGFFYGDWAMGKTGNFEIDFTQDNDVTLDFNMDDYNENIDLHGHVIVSNDIHFDMSWDWRQGSSYLEPGFIKINDNTNDPNIDEVNLYFTYTPPGEQSPQYGANITVTGLGIYLSCEWYQQQGQILPYVWLQYAITGDLDFHLLWGGDWYFNVEEWPQ